MLKVELLCKKYGKTVGCKDISFDMKKDEIIGFIGPNGAGKSTTMNIITGCISADGGSVKADGVSIAADGIEYKKKIGYLPEQPPLYNEFTVLEYLDTVFDMKQIDINKTEHIRDITEKFGLSDVKNRRIGNLSKGYKQRVGLTQAFLGNPSYVILDEPTVGLDPTQKKNTLLLIKSLKKQCGIMLSSHILSEIDYVCDRTIIINKGKIVNVTKDENKNLITYAYGIKGNPSNVMETLRSVKGVKDVKQYGSLYYVSMERNCYDEIFYALAENKMPIISLSKHKVNAEDEFMRATSASVKG